MKFAPRELKNWYTKDHSDHLLGLLVLVFNEWLENSSIRLDLFDLCFVPHLS